VGVLPRQQQAAERCVLLGLYSLVRKNAETNSSKLD